MQHKKKNLTPHPPCKKKAGTGLRTPPPPLVLALALDKCSTRPLEYPHGYPPGVRKPCIRQQRATPRGVPPSLPPVQPAAQSSTPFGTLQSAGPAISLGDLLAATGTGRMGAADTATRDRTSLSAHAISCKNQSFPVCKKALQSSQARTRWQARPRGSGPPVEAPTTRPQANKRKK